ncbi:MAG: hypothetical protein ACTSRI_17055 [Promethearchaeota archaeon]
MTKKPFSANFSHISSDQASNWLPSPAINNNGFEFGSPIVSYSIITSFTFALGITTFSFFLF